MPSSEPAAYDRHWYEQLKPLLTAEPEVFVALEPDAQALLLARQDFDASRHRHNPSLLPNATTLVGREALIGRLQQLLHDIHRTEHNPHVLEAYEARIKQAIAEHSMVIAAVQGDSLVFDTQNNYIYGAPDAGIFASLCAWVRADVASLPPESQADCAELLTLLPEGTGSVHDCLPDTETFAAVKALHARPGGYYDMLFGPGGMPQDAFISEAEGTQIVQQMLGRLGSDYRVDASPGALWSVRPSNKTITCPSPYTLPVRTFVSLLCHELGSHLLEAIQGTSQPLQLLESGLDRFEAGNEGRACLREQIQFDTPLDYTRNASWDPAGIALPSFEYDATLHMLISLATGSTGRRWTFAELYRVAYLLQQLWQTLRSGSANTQACHDFAWHVTVRCLKGTDGMGGAYRKDIVYTEGNIRCWRAARQNPEVILWGDRGKFDIANPRHIRLLTSLGVLPAA